MPAPKSEIVVPDYTPEELAYQQGRRDADIDEKLRSHENRLNAINGSLDRGTKAIRDLEDKIDVVTEQLRTSAAVESDRVAQVRRANEKQISTQMFVLGVAAIIATILAAFIASGRLI